MTPCRALLTLSITLASFTVASLWAAPGEENSPWVDRLEPFGAARGETLELSLVGERLPESPEIVFDTAAIEWVETLSATPEAIRGRVRVDSKAPLGPRLVTVRGRDGRSNTRLFYVDVLRSAYEAEPNDLPPQAQAIELRSQVIHAGLPKLPDVDYYRFAAKAGERWTFDVRSIEYGGFLECNLALLDADGSEVAFNDDRDDYLETPFLEHRFERDGEYLLKIDQYRGPQRVNCDQNCGYMLRLSQGPVVESLYPLGGRQASEVEITLTGSGLAQVNEAYLSPVSAGEYYRLTFPYTMPLRLSAEIPAQGARLPVHIVNKSEAELRARLEIPAGAHPGLWRLWLVGLDGPVDVMSFEISEPPELFEDQVSQLDPTRGPSVVNGMLSAREEEDAFEVEARAGEMLHFSVLAVQLGLPRFDPVLELFDPHGALLAEHDDLMSGQGTVIGNPDPSLYYLPEKTARLRLIVRDRIGRGGPGYVYRLKSENASPGFTLLVDPENPAVGQGQQSEIGVLLIRDPGFDQAVHVWAEQAPQGVEIGDGEFRADQFFGPSADGDNVIIPTAWLSVAASSEATAGEHTLKILGRSDDGQVVEAFPTLWIGPPRNRNDVRRPLPRTTITVREAGQPAPR